jgi:phospholipid transport system substrate-binding protein
MKARRTERTKLALTAARRSALALVAVVAGSALLASVLAAEPAVATDTPAATIESLHRGLVALSHDRPSAELAERYRVLEPLIEKTHDLPYIAELVLRRQWPTLSEAERARFVAAFEKLSVMTYASRFKSVSADTFKMGASSSASDGAAAAAAAGPEAAAGSPADSGRAQVRTAIARPGEADIPLEYLLQQKEGAWRIINIIADGVSDLALKRAEYQRVLAGGTIDDLITYVEAQTARLEQK